MRSIVAGGNTDGFDMDIEFADSWFKVAESELKRRRLEFDDGASTEFRSECKEAAARAVELQKRAGLPDKALFSTGTAVVFRFVSVWDLEARHRDVRIVNTDILRRVREILCPIWPFCQG